MSSNAVYFCSTCGKHFDTIDGAGEPISLSAQQTGSTGITCARCKAALKIGLTGTIMVLASTIALVVLV